MFEYAPTLPLLGEPERAPVVVLKVAHDGLFAMLNVSLSPSASLAAGWKE